MGTIWDLPVRLFHWLLVALVGLCWWSAENGNLDLHLGCGIAVAGLLVFRLIWGFVGTPTARFAKFVAPPARIAAYLRDTAMWRGIGHNPLGALSVLALLGVLTLQVALGLFSTDTDGLIEGPLARLISIEATDWARETHETVFNAVLALAGLHIAAIIWYRLCGKNLIAPMVHGRGPLPDGAVANLPARAGMAALAIGAGLGFSAWLYCGAPLPL